MLLQHQKEELNLNSTPKQKRLLKIFFSQPLTYGEQFLVNFFTNLGNIVGFSQGIKVQRWNAKCF